MKITAAMLLPCLVLFLVPRAQADSSSMVRKRFEVAFTSGSRTGDGFTGTLIYDDSIFLDGFHRRPLRTARFTYAGETYVLGDSRFFTNPTLGFVAEVQAGGSVDHVPVVHYGVSMFMADVQRDFGLDFISTTPTLGQFVEQSRLYYGDNVTLNGIFGAGFTIDGNGTVSYETIPLPEPATIGLITLGGLWQLRRRQH